MRITRWLTQFSASMLLFWWVVIALFLGSCAFGFVLSAHAHEEHGYVHPKDDIEGIVESDPRDPRCPMAYRWKLKDGREYCVVLTEHGLHMKLLGGTDI
jgi:hypothetical protein